MGLPQHELLRKKIQKLEAIVRQLDIDFHLRNLQPDGWSWRKQRRGGEYILVDEVPQSKPLAELLERWGSLELGQHRYVSWVGRDGKKRISRYVIGTGRK